VCKLVIIYFAICTWSADNRIVFREYRFSAHKVSRAHFPEEFAEKMFPRSDYRWI